MITGGVGGQAGSGSSPDALRRGDREHRARLFATWGLVADFCFGDLLFFERDEASSDLFVVVGQIRSTTSQTLYEDDLIGKVVTAAERPLLVDAWVTGQILQGLNFGIGGAQSARVGYIPVRRELPDGTRRVVGVLTRELSLDETRRPGRLERTYLEVFDRLAEMIVSGAFPFAALDEELDLHDTPRVGDGVMTIDTDGVVTYGSPNAVSALHKLGMVANLEGRPLGELIPGSESIVECFETRVPSQLEVEARREEGRIVVALRSLPLLSNGLAVGAVVLLRDVSDLRRRDRLLDNKDATIREVHHRVKNNLQTISALLRLQGRRLESAEAKQAIEESVRRIRTIALVHETLSKDVRDAVPFDDIVRPLVRMVEEGLASPDRPLKISVTGALGDLPPETATPLAVVLTELLQNSLEHGYPNGTTQKNPGRVDVVLANDPINLSIDVRDNGVGLPDDFSLSGSRSLGLSIVRSLVTTELGGVIAFRNEEGTVVNLRIPREADPRAR